MDEKGGGSGWIGPPVPTGRLLRVTHNTSDLREVLRVLDRRNAPNGPCQALCDMFGRARRIGTLMRAAVDVEVDRAGSAAAIARGNNAAARILLMANRSVIERVGSKIEPVVAEYLARAADHKARGGGEGEGEGEGEGAEDILLASYAEKAARASLVSPLPAEFKVLVSHLYFRTRDRHPGKELRIASGFLFLRIVGPAIIRFGRGADAAARPKQLLRLSKAVQRIFLPPTSRPQGADSKEGGARAQAHAFVAEFIVSITSAGNNKAAETKESSPLSKVTVEECDEKGTATPRGEGGLEWGKDCECVASYLESLQTNGEDSIAKAKSQEILQVFRRLMAGSPPESSTENLVAIGGIAATVLAIYFVRLLAIAYFAGHTSP